MEIEELNFLKEELKKVNAQIEKLQYSSGVIESQVTLWELRDKIKGEIRELMQTSEIERNQQP